MHAQFTPEEASRWLRAEKRRRGLTYEAEPSRGWRTLPVCNREDCDLPAEYGGRCWRCGLEHERTRRKAEKQRAYLRKARKAVHGASR